MHIISNLKLLAKILLLLGCFAVISIGSSFFTTSKMRYIDNTYQSIVEGSELSILAILRANRDLVYLDRTIYRMLIELDPTKKHDAAQDFDKTIKSFHKQINKASLRMPAKAEQFNVIASTFDKALANSCASTIQLANSLNPTDLQNAQVSMKNTCEPALLDIMTSIKSLTTDIVLMNGDSVDSASATTNHTIFHTYLFNILGLIIIMIFSGIMVSFSISKPLRKLTQSLEQLSKGNFNILIDNTQRQDEIGEISRAALIFCEQGRETSRLRNEQERTKQEQERLKVAAEQERKSMMLALADDFENSVQGIVDAVSNSAKKMQNTAQELATTAEQTSNDSMNASSASNETSANVQNVASSAEELNASITEISNQVTQSTAITNKVAENGEAANMTMQTLSKTINNIDEVVHLIETIADQTTLLALNATIEASRAGSAGKGFAVVASEVKTLAGQTAKATEDINLKIKSIQAETKNAVEAIVNMCTTLENVKETYKIIAASVHEQSSVTKEISNSAQQAASKTQLVTSNITTVTNAAKATGSSATQMLSAASDLSSQSDILREQVKKFLMTVRES
jgi:methyl-accepting chemotaxis protein